MDKTKAKEIQWVGSQEMQGLIYKEIFEEMVYEKFFEVEEGDIVLDIGASFGPFTHSILPKKPKQVYCVEPGETQFPVLVKNTLGHPVCSINKGIWHTNERVSSDRVYDSINQSMDGITFKKLVQLYGLDKIDFLKTDCEGGEYFIFNEENFEFIQNNVRKIVGEWHLGPPDLKERFRKFRDLYLAKIENYCVFSVNGMDIKWDLWNEHFLEYYSEIIIYIDNRKKEKRPFSELLREKHSKLDYRLETFAKAFDYLESLKHDYYVIVETGTVRTFGEYEDGQSTILFDEFVNYHDGVVYTVDIDPKCKEIVTEHCSKKVKAYTGDSIEFLRNLEVEPRIDLLYLDSMDIDWDNPAESMEHHFKEFSSVLHSLKDKCLILSDDNALKKPVGKGMLVDTYFKNAGVERFIDGFQLGWIFKATAPEVENKSVLLMGHASYIGHTGYNEHTRNFFRKLNNFYPVKVRNFAYIPDQSYLDELDHKILMEQTWVEPPYKAGTPCKFDKEEVIDIVLAETNHHFFYGDYKDHRRIAYNAWESTLYPDEFFKKLLEYDQLWVPSTWARDCAIKQGFPEDRVKVVPEGVDGTIFHPATEVTKLPSEYDDGRFKFLLFGRWDSRKSITEIIQTFLKTFDKSEPVDLVVSIDNPFPEPDQKGKTTEQYLRHLGLDDPRIHVKHFPPLEEYISYLQHGHVFVSCSRSEGWNLPLIQAISCGIPTICSEYGAQLDFAKGVSHMVRIKEMRPIKYLFMYDNPPPGEFSEPDFDHLSEVMRELHDNYPVYTEKAMKDAYGVIEKFKWENAAKIASKLIDELQPRIKPPESITVNYHFVKKPFINIVGNSPDTFKVSFIDKSKNEQERSRIVFSLDLKCGHWAAANRQWFTDWRLQVEKGKEVIFTHDLDFKNKRVFINLDSKSLGDTIAWFPYIEEFRKKHGCTVIAATFWNSLFADNYPELTFVEPGVRVDNLYAQYSLSYEFHNDFDRNPIPCKQVTLQQVATNHLGLDYVELKPKIKIPPLWDDFHKDMDKFLTKSSKKQYVCIAEHSTSMCKYWNYPKGWQEVVDYLRDFGYAVVALGKESTYLKDTWKRTGIPIEKTLAYLANASFFIGMGSGLAWLAWAIDIPTIMISGCSEKYVEFKETEKNIRIINESVCHGCLNDMDWEFDKSDWYWCPAQKNFECTRSISPETVFKAIDKLLVV